MFINNIIRSILCVTCLSFAVDSICAEQPTSFELTEKERAKVDAGEILVSVSQDGHLTRAVMYAKVDAPVEDVWEILGNCRLVPQWNPEVRYMKVVSQEGDTSVVEGVNNMPWPMEDRHWQMESAYGQIEIEEQTYQLATWQYVKGSGNIVDSNGYWLGMPVGENKDQTILKYVLRADIGLWLPRFLVNWATGKVLPNSIKGMRKIHKETFNAENRVAGASF